MNDIDIIDNYMDDREFRNYIVSLLPEFGFVKIKIEDERISDEDKLNDNDIFARKDKITYTVLTYLNKEITEKELEECHDDIEKEHVARGIVVSNLEVSDEIRAAGEKINVEIIDRKMLIQKINGSIFS